MFASILGKFNDVGVAGVSCVIGNNGFSKNGNDGSLKDIILMSADNCEITGNASINGFVTPILAAFSANAFLTSSDNVIGLKILFLTELTSMLDNLPVADLYAFDLIFKIYSASKSY